MAPPVLLRNHTVETGDPSSLPELEREILGYLLRNPSGEDSIEGIAEWWLLEQRIMQARQEVRQALVALQKRGYVESRTVRGGVTVYRLNRDRNGPAPAHHPTREPALHHSPP